MKKEVEIDCEDQSFRNLVEWYREDLIRIKRGELATKVLGDNSRVSLHRQGVLIRGAGSKGRTIPTERALKILGDHEK